MSTPVSPPDAPGPSPTPTRRRWRDRERPMLVPWLTAASAPAVFQALFLIWRFHLMGASGAELTIGLARFGTVVAFLTALLLLPLMMVLRRLHPGWKGADRAGASAAAALGLVAGVAGWLVADRWLAPLGLASWLSSLLALAGALLGGLAAAVIRVPRSWLRLGIVAAPALLLLLVVPLPVSSTAPASDEASTAPSPARPVASVPGPRPDVVLITVDTLRADSVGAYRRGASITPEIDRFFREGVSFERVLTASPWTVPSLASIHTGLSTLAHGAGLPLGAGQTFRRSPLASRHTTLAERFAAAGYRTRAVVANGFAGQSFGMGQGFEEFSSPFESAMGVSVMSDLPLPRLIVALTPKTAWGDYRASGVTDKALAWLTDDDETPLFLWVHYLDPHTPFQADPDLLDPAALAAMIDQKQPPVLADGTVVGDVFVATDLVRSGTLWLGPADRRRLQEYYDRAVGYVDRHVGRLLAALRERSHGRRVVAAFTADHGEEFWDHGHFEHGHDYYREITRAPLAFWGPPVVPEGRAVAELVGLADVGPTLLELAGLEVPVPKAVDEGRSLVATWRADGATPHAPAPPRFSEGNLYGLPAVLVEDADWRFLLRANGAQELYHAHDDPGERDNVALDHPERVDLYRQMLEPRLESILRDGDATDPGEISAEMLQSLRALGYVK